MLEVSRALSAIPVAQSLILLLNIVRAYIFFFIAAWNDGSSMEFVTVRTNDSHCSKGNLIHLNISIDLGFFFDENILSLVPEICAYMTE